MLGALVLVKIHTPRTFSNQERLAFSMSLDLLAVGAGTAQTMGTIFFVLLYFCAVDCRGIPYALKFQTAFY